MTPRVQGSAGVWWAVALVAVSMVLALALSAHPERLEAVRSADTDSYSYSLIGYRGLHAFLERSGFEVSRVRVRHWYGDTGTVLVIAEPDAPPVGRVVKDSTDTDEKSPIDVGPMPGELALVLPKWRGVPDERTPAWLHEMKLLPLADVARAGSAYIHPLTTLVRGGGTDSLRCATAWGESLTVAAPRLQWLKAPPRAVPIVWRDSIVIVARFEREFRMFDWDDEDADTLETVLDPLYVISDPDLLNNRGLARADHARLVRRLFAEELAVHRVLFDERIHHGLLSRSLAAELLGFPLVLLFAQAIVLLVFLAWASSARFGAPTALAPRPTSGAALVDTAAELLSAAGIPALTLQIYWEQVLREVAGRYGIGTAGTRRRLLADVAELSRARGAQADVRTLEEDVERLQRTTEHRDVVVHTARRIHGWYREMIHGR
jgi:hypothetical protein